MITCDACLPHINSELERLLGILQPLMEVCEVEEEKFFRGEQSLYDVCIAVDCEVKLSAQSVAEYVSRYCCIPVWQVVHSLVAEQQ